MKNIYVVKPMLPNFKRYQNELREIWESGILTNDGSKLKKLEENIEIYLNVKNLMAFNNGTVTLMTAIASMDLKGEVITTPFTFAATAGSIVWAGCKPVFVDIDPETLNICPDEIKKAINKNTVAIMAVHCYGNVCEVEKIEEIAFSNNLKVIYDAAHAFAVDYKGKSVCLHGDVSSLSFHATKIFSTVEGGALIVNNENLTNKIRQLRNFGIESELQIDVIGLNGKMSELHAAFGMLNLEGVQGEIIKRKKVSENYHELLKDQKKIKFLKFNKFQSRNYSYFPILINGDGENREQVYNKLKQNGVYARRYFSPLLTETNAFSGFKKFNLTNASKVSREVLCLPFYGDLKIDEIDKIVELIKNSI